MNKWVKKLSVIFMFILVGCTPTVTTQQAVTTQSISKEAYDNFVGTQQAIEETNTYRVYEYVVMKEQQKIYGQLVLPKHYAKQLPVVLIGHGFNSSYAANMAYAKALANNGIAAYAFDFIGGSTVSKSDGDMTNMSIMTQVSDMEVVMAQFRTLEFLDSNNLFLMGDSQGGLVAALTAGKHADNIKGLVLVYPALRMPKFLQRLSNTLESMPDNALTLMNATVGKRFVRDVANLDVPSEIVKFKKNVLIVQGDSDLIVPLSSSQEAVTLYDHAVLEVIKGAGHGFDDEQMKIVNAKIVHFVVNQLK